MDDGGLWAGAGVSRTFLFLSLSEPAFLHSRHPAVPP